MVCLQGLFEDWMLAKWNSPRSPSSRGFRVTGRRDSLARATRMALERSPPFLESSQPGLFVTGDVRHGIDQTHRLRRRRGQWPSPFAFLGGDNTWWNDRGYAAHAHHLDDSAVTP